MKFNYKNNDDLVYGVEWYKFRFKNREVADIELTHLLEQGKFSYRIIFADGYVDKDLKEIENNSFLNRIEINSDFEKNSVFDTREEALQDAIDLGSHIMENYSN